MSTVEWEHVAVVTEENMLALLKHFAGGAYIDTDGHRVVLNVNGRGYRAGDWITLDGRAPTTAATSKAIKVGDRVRRVGPHTIDTIDGCPIDFGNRECKVGDTGIVTHVYDDCSDVSVKWVDRNNSSVIAEASLEVIDG